MRKMIVPIALLGLTACNVSMPSESAICRESAAPRAALNAGLLAHPETPEAVGSPAVDVLIVLSVCES